MDPASMMALSTLMNVGGQFLSKKLGGGDKVKKLSNYTPEQKQFFDQYLQQTQQMQGPGGGIQNSLGILQQYLNPESDVYKNFEAPYMNKFQNQVLPGIAERFGGMNAMGGGLMSSGFGQALGGAASDFQSQLAGLKSGLQRSAIQDMFGLYGGMSQNALGAQPFSYTHQPGESNPIMSGLSGFNQGMMQNGAWGSGGGGGGSPFSSIANWFGSGGGQNNLATQNMAAGIRG